MTSEFGKMVRRLRSRAGMTQDDLEQRSTLGIRTIRRVESGEHPNLRMKTVQLLAEGLGLEGNELEEFIAAAGRGAPRPSTEPEPPGEEESRIPDELAEAAASLAQELRLRWREEEEHRQLRDPFPLPVRWRPMAPEQLDLWANIRRSPPGEAAEPMDLTGRLGRIADIYRQVPSGRLVVLGRAGTGKSILALRFALDRLSGDRRPTDPVPVIFRLESWNPGTTKLRDWMAAQLLRDHPGLGAPAHGGSTLAAALVNHDLILPVLDGFDEIAKGLRHDALNALNAATDMPLLMTSRPDEYRTAVGDNHVLKAAAGVHLTDLDPSDLVHYLRRTTTRRTGKGAPLWDPVLAGLRGEPGTAGANIAAALSTPLMASMARTVYSDTHDEDPSELLETDRFGDADAIERHLLGNFVPTVYRSRPGGRRYEPEQARRWLGYLARHLKRLDTHDLAWWQFGTSMRRRARMPIMVLAVGLVFGLADTVVEAIFAGEMRALLVVYGVVFGLMIGTIISLVQEFAVGSRQRFLEPSRIQMRIRDRSPSRRRNAAHRFRTGLISGLVGGIGYGILNGMLDVVVHGIDPGQSLVNAFFGAAVFGSIFAFASGFAFGLIGLCEEPLDIESVGSPEDLIRTNRTAVIVQVSLFAASFGIALPSAVWSAGELLRQFPSLSGVYLDWDPNYGLSFGLIGGIGGGMVYALGMTAWGQWLVFARVWLPLTGRLPWAVPAFLEDAYDRGVLRRAGVVYQFRHERLQDHLADVDRTDR
ncbi:helix-turn-helix domain-containing protein [Glycomyces salinus]|uniref:helix-turn-helix domain-containing protein n=1 Tax=Glycomyces salinus TaxID=980294 RepID=UPI0018EAA24A|nr:helix-turn-helix domain-containing protein [Glycomyces salinus]